MVARLEPPKDQASLIRAAQHIRGRIPRCHFLFAGDGSRREALAALSADLGLGDCVHLPGTMQNVPGVVKIADVCVLSSFQEGLPRAVQEYMAAGKPVVASDVGGMRELLHDGEEGCLVGPGDSEALADRITFLLLHPEAAAIMGGKGRIAARERFASGTMCKAYEALYGEILEPTRAGAALS
jgi:glycosyltransferase involved in cell wall biosynthesis